MSISTESFPRDLTLREREVLVAMIQRGTDPEGIVTEERRERWLAQVDDVQVLGRCRCGQCPSIELTPEPDDERQSRIVLDADAPGLGLLLFIDDDQPSYLEGYPLEDRHIGGFPPVSEITFG